MLLVMCPRHGGEVLIWTSGIDRIRNTPAGIEVDYHCTCGHRGVWRPAGSRAAQADTADQGTAERVTHNARAPRRIPEVQTA